MIERSDRRPSSSAVITMWTGDASPSVVVATTVAVGVRLQAAGRTGFDTVGTEVGANFASHFAPNVHLKH